MDARPQRQPLVSPGAFECHVADLTATFSAEMTLRLAQWRLGEFDQWLPIDGDPNLTLGELVERNSTGPLRLGFGGWRDLLLGCQFINGSGELISAGGRTVKNVAGYDLTKFMIGQRGLFGKIVTVTIRTHKRPAGTLLACFEKSDSLIGELMVTALRPQWALLDSSALWCGYMGDEAALALYQRLLAADRIETVGRSLQDDIADRAMRWRVSNNYFRAAVPPAAILRFVSEAGLTTAWSADAVFGVVVGAIDKVDVEGIVGAARKGGGSAMIFRGGDFIGWLPNGVEMTMLRKLKSGFDPEGRLALFPTS